MEVSKLIILFVLNLQEYVHHLLPKANGLHHHILEKQPIPMQFVPNKKAEVEMPCSALLLFYKSLYLLF